MENDKRFADGGARIEEFSDEFLVVCPKCGKMCNVRIDGADAEAPWHAQIFMPRKVTCLHCGFSNKWTKHSEFEKSGENFASIGKTSPASVGGSMT